jgi:N-acylglucosamine-6-phosphate 2-epimerase
LDLLEHLRGKLVVSCQPVDGGPMDQPDITAAMALAAMNGGAAGLRVEGIANLRAVRAVTKLPIIGIVKHDLAGSEVRITPFPDDVAALADAGADVIAYDATMRARPFSCTEIRSAIKASGRLAMADCASLADGEDALNDGADILGTTLSGYAYDSALAQAGPDLALITQFSHFGGFVMAEGRLNSPQDARAAMLAGADCVTVGSAITRIEVITDWFVQAIAADEG